MGVDPKLRQNFWEYFDRMAAEGKTVLITTHLMDEAEKCQRIGYMRAGRMAAEGCPEEILGQAGLNPILQLWLAGPEEGAALLSRQGYSASVKDDAVLVELDARAQVKEILALVEPRREEAFLLLAEDR